MKLLTINRLTLLFGLMLFVNFYFFNRAISEITLTIIYGTCLTLGIHNRKPDKPYTYGRGVLIGLRILLLGTVYWLVFALIASGIKTFIPLLSPDGVNIFQATQDLMYHFAVSLPSLIIISIASFVLLLVFPLFFLRKSTQTDNIIDSNLVNDEK